MPVLDTPERRFAIAIEKALTSAETFEQAKARMIGAAKQLADDKDAELRQVAGLAHR